MTVAIIRHFENMRTLLRAYDGIKNSGSWPFPESVFFPPVDSNTQQNQMYSLFIVSQATEMGKFFSL